MAAQPPDFVIASLRGGMNDTDPAHSLEADEVVLAQNVEFWTSTLGERRLGSEIVNIDGSGLDDEDVIFHLGTFVKKQMEVKDTNVFAAACTLDTSVSMAMRDENGVWAPVTTIDAVDPSDPDVLRMQSQGLHGKLFIAYKSDEDRMHVYDPRTGTIRRTGLRKPGHGPTAVDTAVGGAYTEDRTFRIRYILIADGKTLLRSEPSDEFLFTPSGVNDGAIVTRPPLINEGETDWELEASDGDGNFYRIDSQPIATTSVTDRIQPATDYANIGVLSEDIEDYDLIPSVKFVKADQDRLIFGGSWEDDEKGSRVSWTPVWAAPGVGNDERIPLDTDNFLDLDWMDGGDLTGLSDPVNGSFYAFKWTRVYKLQRTGNVNQAYEAFLLSPSRGAVPGSIVSGMDEFGRGCVYFLDPEIGPSRIGSQGIQQMRSLRETWLRVNTSADKIVSHGVYYPSKQQVHWWVAVDGADTPSFRIVSQVSEIRSTADGTSRGWTTATGLSSYAWCSTIVPEVITQPSGSTSLLHRPYVGMEGNGFLFRMDTGSTDNYEEYRAIIRTKPYILTGLLNKWGAMTAALMAVALDDHAVTIDVKMTKNFKSAQTNFVNTNFAREEDEDIVIKVFDNLRMSDARVIQVEFSDPEE